MKTPSTSAKKASSNALADAAKTSPTATFDDPSKVVGADGLSVSEKSEILAQWEADAIALQTATDEGMSGGNRPRLDEVKSAQTMLGANNAIISAGATNVTCIETFDVENQNADKLIDALEALAKQAKSRNVGYISTSVHKSHDGTSVVNYSQWASKHDIDLMRLDTENRALIAKVKDAAVTSSFMIYDVVFAE